MKHRIIVIGVILLVLGGMLCANSNFSLGIGGAVAFTQNEKISEIDPMFGFSLRVGASDYVSGYFDMLFYEPAIYGGSLPPGTSIIVQDMMLTGALTFPISIGDTSKLKLGGGYTLLWEKWIGKSGGETATLIEVETSGFNVLAEIIAGKFTGCLKYIVPKESDNAQGILMISAIYNVV